MAYKTNEVIKSELEALSIGYDDDMTNAELQGLLDEAMESSVMATQDKENKVITDLPMVDDRRLTHANIGKSKKEAPAEQAPEVTNGVGTTNDHERRIFALEQAAK